MKKQLLTMALLLLTAVTAQATDYYVATTGSDSNDGLTAETAFATIVQAQSVAHPGDKVYIQPGTYQPTTFSATAAGSDAYGSYSIVFKMNVSGTAVKPISYIGVLDGDGNRPVFDFSGVSANTNSRITGFLVSASYLVFKNLDIKGTPQLLDCRTNNKNCQSENIRVTNGSYNTFENIACHDSKAIGFYVTQNSAGNLFVNCDAYNNYDPLSANNAAGGNCDGFGCHVNAGYAKNKFIGCRAWNNSDDGFDLINCYSPVTFAYSFAYKNGYDANGTARGDGNGFKAGGYGMSSDVTEPDGGFPCHVVTNCISTNNKTNGIYTNHHMGGVNFNHNTAIDNAPFNSTTSRNYSFVRRNGLTAAAATNVDGYGHTVANNLSYNDKGWHVGALDGTDGQNTVTSNSFSWNGSAWENDALDASATFESTSTDLVTQARLTTGYLNPETTLNYGKKKVELNYGADFSSYVAAVAEARETSGAEIEEYNPTKVAHAITTTTLWTFDGIDAGTALSSTEVYDHNHLFISGHNQTDANKATVTSGGASNIQLDGTNIVSVSNHLHFAGTYASFPSATTAANTFVRDCASFYAGVEGTLYIYASAAAVGRGIKIVIDGVEETLPNVMTAADSPVLNTKVIPAKSNVFISSTTGGWDLYALKFVPTATEPEPETVSVFLTAGQSNTAGRCMNENLPNYIQTLGSNNGGAYQYCNWSYTNGSTRLSDKEGVLRKFWPEMESSGTPGRFAYDAIVYYWIEQALQKDFYVVKHAAGGTSIDPTCTSTNDYHWSADADWLSEHASCNTEGGTSMLKALCSNIDKTLDALTAAGKTPDVKCLIWHQGESDRSGTGPDGYHDNLAAVVQYVRNYLVSKTGDEKYATLSIIAGTVPTNSKQYNKKVYDALFTLQDEDTNFHVIETSPGTFIGDQLHFDANCAERLGIGMYNKMVDLGLVNGEKQTVPKANVPEETTITLDFQTWTNENLADANTYASLIAEETSSLKTIDGTTPLFVITGSDASGDFSEFAETFAMGTPANVQLRGGKNGLIANKKTSIFTLLNLEPGDRVTITTKSGAGTGVNSLQFVSTNAYKDGDATKTAVVKDAEWAIDDSYIITEGTQIDLMFGATANSSHYIYKVVIEKGAVEIEPEATVPVVHMCGDSMMSIYGDKSSDTKANDTYTQGMRGWGQFFQDYFTDESGVIVQDWAHTGTTAKGFYSGANYWPVVMGTNTMTDAYKEERPYVKDFVPVKAGDYVIMCWGHNDQKGGSLHNGYKTITESEYLTYLTTMVNEVKAKGAYPILATSICRSLFSGNSLTRLGKIDACEAAGETHSDSDDPFDYPAAMRNLAAELGVPCIDLNAASQTLWEDFGPGLTASVFFENVGTTHTAEKGARAMGIAANLIIRDWDTTAEMYANYATLKAAMKTDVTQYNKADYASSETVVATETLWTFEQSADGETTYNSGDVIADDLLDYNGLYMRAYGSHTITAATPASTSVSITLADDTQKAVDVSMAALSSGNTAFVNNIPATAGAATNNNTDRAYAINTAGAGTLYAVFYCTGNGTSENPRYVRISFDGTEIADKRISVTTKNTTHQIDYHGDKAGTYCFWSEPTSQLLAVYYVPDTDSSEDEMHEPGSTVSVTIGSQGYSSFSSSQALDFSDVEGLNAYVVSSVNAAGKAVLSAVSSVPAETGLILKGTAGEEYDIPVAASTPEAPASNLLVATVTATAVAASTDAVHNYMFANGNNGLGFYNVATATTSKAGKAYLSTGTATLSAESTGSHSFVFDDENATGIREKGIVKSEQFATAQIYDLQGRRVAQPTKGLYFVNGKKVVIK